MLHMEHVMAISGQREVVLLLDVALLLVSNQDTLQTGGEPKGNVWEQDIA